MKLIIVALSLVFAMQARAAIGEAPDWTIHEEYSNARSQGMGGAYTAVADDYYSILWNPAGLARLKQKESNFFVQAMADDKILGFYNDIENANKSGSNKDSDISNVLQENYGHHFSARLPTLGVLYARPGWGFAIIPADLSVEADIRQTLGPAAAVVATEDTTLAYGRGYNIRLRPSAGQLSWGFTGRAVYRLYVNKVAAAYDIALNNDIFSKGDAREGLGLDGDLGLLYSLPTAKSGVMKWLKPTFGFAIRNVLDSGFGTNFHLLGSQSGTPYVDERRFDVGVNFELPKWWVFKSHLALEEHDMAHENFTFRKGSHVGIESLFQVRSWLQGAWRAGFNQGYWTLGLSGLLGVLQIDLATYGEEVGPSSASQENRRYMARLNLNF
jgi:hypothetical protein